MRKTILWMLIALLAALIPSGPQAAWAADSLASMPGGGRQLLSAAAMADGKVLVTGGNTGIEDLNTALIYDPSINQWYGTLSMQEARFSHTSTLLQDGRILVAGGANFTVGALDSAEIFDPATISWSSAASMSTPRQNATASLLPDGRVLVAGGTNNYGDLNTVEIYDPESDTWTAGPNMDATRKEHGAAALGDGRILLSGGKVAGVISNSAIIFDPSLNTWTDAEQMPTARYVHASVPLADGRVEVNGGLDDVIFSPLDSTLIYDPEANVWLSGNSMNSGRLGHDAVLLQSGLVFVVGGADNGGVKSDSESHSQDARPSMPTVDLAPGTVPMGTSIALSSSLVGASIYYTTDGTKPNLSSPVYSEPIIVNESLTIRAIAYLAGQGASSVMSAAYTVPDPAAVPVAAPSGGAVPPGTEVTLTTATEDAVIRYTTDGSEPDADSPLYEGPIVVAEAVTIKAIAMKPDMTDSAVMTESYTIMEQAASPVAAPSGGEVASGTLVALTSATEDAVIRYTTDGSEPDADSPLYDGPIAVTEAVTIQAIAMKPGMTDSEVMTESYTIMGQAAVPVASPSGGEVASGTLVALTSATEGAVIRYTTDGSEPDADSPLYDGPIAVTEAVTIKAIAMKPGMTDSAVMTESYTIMEQAAIPVASPSGGEVASGTLVALTSATEDAVIRYTKDGGEPDADSLLYEGPIAVTEAVTIKAIAMKPGMTDSAVMSESYTIAPVQNPRPSPPSPTETSSGAAVIVIVNGKTENAGTATTTQRNGRRVTTIAVDERRLAQILEQETDGIVVTLPVDTDSETVIGEWTGRMVKNLESKQAVLEIRTGAATYKLPAQLIQIESILAQLGNEVKLEDVRLQVEISEPAAETAQLVQESAASRDLTLVASALEFHVRVSYGDQSVELRQFDTYVQRTIALPDDADPSRITTGVVVEPNGTVVHVPTQVVRIDGNYYAKINSLSNSVYAVVWHPMTFPDMFGHWAQEAVNDMGSRMVIDGFEDGGFRPDEDVTRAEFAAIVVRGLGIGLAKGEAPFQDVSSSDWHNDVVHTAFLHGLIQGYEDGTFRPQERITREEAVAILAKAMAITGLGGGNPGADPENVLAAFADADSVAEWAKVGMASALDAGIVSGRDGSVLDPKAFTSRAEAAVLIRNLLLTSDLI